MTFKDIKVGECFISCFDGLAYVKLSNWYAVKQGDYHTYTFAPDDLTHSGSNDPNEAFAICVKNQRPHSCWQERKSYNNTKIDVDIYE